MHVTSQVGLLQFTNSPFLGQRMSFVGWVGGWVGTSRCMHEGVVAVE